MFGYFNTSSATIGSYGITEVLGKLTRDSSYLYMEELDMNSSQTKLMKCVTTTEAKAQKVVPKKDDQNVVEIEDQTGWNIRVKVLMTKEQAVRLLSKCKSGRGDGEIIKDVACELIEIPNNRRVALISSSSDGDHELETFWAERPKFD